MIHSKLRNTSSSVLLKAILLAAVTSASSFAAVIYDTGITTIGSATLTQNGRISRSGVPSDWSAPKAFPGIVNTGTVYSYTTYTIPTSPFPYLQISFFDASGIGALFDSAYLNSYSPTTTGPNFGLSNNYLGDAGSSANLFGTTPVAFQVILANPAVDRLIVVVNDTTVGLGRSQSFNLLVEGFYDTQFNDTTPPPAVPEPGSLGLTGLATCSALLYLRRRKAA